MPTSRIDEKQVELLVHRSRGLLELGFTAPQTLELVNRNDIVHEAEALLARAWPHEWIVDELSDRKDSHET